MYATIVYLRFLAVSLVVLGTLTRTQGKYGGGRGTAEDPYLIYTPEQMNTIGANPQH